MMPAFQFKQFVIVVLLVSLWVNASEVFRYFLFVMPDLRAHLSMVPHVAPMNWSVFLLWGVWDTVLTAFIVFTFWLVAHAFGNTARAVCIAGLTSWVGFFLLFWAGLCNMGLALPQHALLALPLALLETLIASYIASRLYRRAG